MKFNSLVSTIGFGDMVPDRNFERIRSPVVRRVYLAGIIVWIILGMGYIWGVVEIIRPPGVAGSGCLGRSAESCCCCR